MKYLRLKIYFGVIILILTLAFFQLESCKRSNATTLISPDGKTVLNIGIKEGKVFYMVNYDNQTVIDTSFLALYCRECILGRTSKILNTVISAHDSIWKSEIGEEELIRNNYKELRVSLLEEGSQPVNYDIIFRLYEDGVGFRYVIPEQGNLESITVLKENTHFNLKEDAVAWYKPIRGTGTEGGCFSSLVSRLDTVKTPLTLKMTDKIFLSLMEIPSEMSSGLSLTVPPGTRDLQSFIAPQKTGRNFENQKEIKLPWYAILIAQSPSQLMLSRMTLNLRLRENHNPFLLPEIPVIASTIPDSQYLEALSDSNLSRMMALNVVMFDPRKNNSNILPLFLDTPGWDFMVDCPKTWAKTLVPEAKLGEYITVLRKKRDSDTWFAGSINNECPHTVNLSLDFLDPGCEYQAKIFSNTDLTLTPGLDVKTIKVDSRKQLPLHLKSNSGKAILFTKIR